jgi:hypothetical protein
MRQQLHSGADGRMAARPVRAGRRVHAALLVDAVTNLSHTLRSSSRRSLTQSMVRQGDEGRASNCARQVAGGAGALVSRNTIAPQPAVSHSSRRLDPPNVTQRRGRACRRQPLNPWQKIFPRRRLHPEIRSVLRGISVFSGRGGVASDNRCQFMTRPVRLFYRNCVRQKGTESGLFDIRILFIVIGLPTDRGGFRVCRGGVTVETG